MRLEGRGMASEPVIFESENGIPINTHNWGIINRGDVAPILVCYAHNIGDVDIKNFIIKFVNYPKIQGDPKDTIFSSLISTDNKNWDYSVTIPLLKSGEKVKLYVKWQPRYNCDITEYKWRAEGFGRESTQRSLCPDN